ncbi:NAD(P)-binding protein [Thozetella sp. PMI_491]|nr:NAD(P)-binding protein [Thozetella sp. PMI_491]
MATQNKQIIIKARPHGDIVPDQVFETRVVPAPTAADVKDGQILVEVLYLSLDPAMRFWLDGGGYMNLKLGDVMGGYGLVRVVASRAADVVAGDIGTAWAGWCSFAVITTDTFRKVEAPKFGKLSDAMGVLGLTGLTGYEGMLRVGRPKAGETVVVSTAAGATGSIAAQTAKINGARVIGITGSDAKCQWLKELGLDVALNYKSPNFEQEFGAAVGDGLDVYFDNVGGKMLEMALAKLNSNGRIAICGDIGNYNATERYGITNYFQLALTGSTMQGVNVFNYLDGAQALWKDMARLLDEGKLKRTDTVIKGKLEDAPAVLLDVYAGKNVGKMILDITS